METELKSQSINKSATKSDSRVFKKDCTSGLILTHSLKIGHALIW